MGIQDYVEKRPCILIVDDDQVIRETLAAVLSRSYNVILSSSASQAIEGLQNVATDNFPEVALLDLMMPGINGLDLLDLLKQQFPQLPVIMLTSSESVQSVVRAMKTGASDYLVKPFKVEELLFRLAEVRAASNGKNPKEQKDFSTLSKNFERQQILEALKKYDYIQTRAAKALGITRRMLKYRMDKLGIDV